MSEPLFTGGQIGFRTIIHGAMSYPYFFSCDAEGCMEETKVRRTDVLGLSPGGRVTGRAAAAEARRRGWRIPTRLDDSYENQCPDCLKEAEKGGGQMAIGLEV